MTTGVSKLPIPLAAFRAFGLIPAIDLSVVLNCRL